MKKIPLSKILTPKIRDRLAEENDWPDEWWDYVNELEYEENSNTHEHPWSWYMEQDIRTREGWTLVNINPIHKNITVAHWLKENNVEFKYDRTAFLIKDSKYATMVILKYA
jgi:hypothetical protein